MAETTYNRIKQETHAVQWNAAGDHAAVEPYIRRLDDGQNCPVCGNDYNSHGWLPNRDGGQRVCPSDYVLTFDVTNILTENQATATDKLGDITGFTIKGTALKVVASSTTSIAPYDRKAPKVLKVACDGSEASQGVTVDATTVTAGKTYTFQTRVLAPAGQAMKLTLVDNGTEPQTVTVAFVGTGAYQDVSGKITIAAGGSTLTENVYFDGTVDGDFYLDELQLANLPRVSNWGVGVHTEAGNCFAIKPADFAAEYEEYAA